MDFARTMLERAGEFYPFGATLSQQGEVAAVGGYNGEEHPIPTEIYKLLAGEFESGASSGRFLGVALAANVNVPPNYESPFPDALRVHIEANDYARFIYVPYALSKKGFFRRHREVEYGTPFAVEIAPSFYGRASNG
ncbi:hypothetical protein [Undibacterium jejuense]|nr:hypothetical protein [Undibacterium jejuense]